jgi:hypothetical protein
VTDRASSRVWWVAALLACVLVNPYVRGDGNGYYAWLVSPVIDGDLDFTNQFQRADPLFQTLIFELDGSVRPEARTVTGRVGNQWSVGPAVMWAPWFLVAHAGVLLARALGATVAADGYSWPYLWLVSMSTVLYGMAALWLSARVATRLGYGRGAGVAALGIGLASSLPVYQVFLPFHVHALAACAVAAFIAWVVWRGTLSTAGDWVVWGALAGLMVQVYHLNGVLVLPAIWVWYRTITRDGWMRAFTHGVVFVAAALTICLPQLIGKTLLYGRPWITGYQDQFIWSDPRLWQTLLSTNHGWWLWTPVVVIAVAGLVRVWRSHGEMRPWLLAGLVFYVAVASYQNWHGQSSFGNRFFISLSLVLVVGLAAVADWAAGRGTTTRRTLAGVIAGLAVWNAGFMFQWGTNIIPNRGAVSFREVAVNQVTVVPARVTGFLRRYLGDRHGVQDDVERDDVRQRRGHEVVR